MSYFVYILKSGKVDRFYIGQTNSIENRLKRHNAGYEKSTKAYRPWDLYFVMEFETRAEAIKLERRLKNKKSHKRLEEWIEKQS